MPDLPSHFGPYEVISQLGAGGMGQVYLARDRRLHRNVAIKILREASALDPDRQRRFAQEAVAASALNHPNIITVYDVGVEGQTPYLVSELIEGISLRAEMNRGRMPLKRVIDVAHQIAEGLAAAHEAGIVHRDLKPENVMVTRDGRVKIVDFGLAKPQSGDESLIGAPTETQTAAGLILGTVPYMSPEQARGSPADFRSDQFALGVMLYEMTTATHPFKRDTAVQTLSAIITDEPPDPAGLNPALPVPLRWLMRRLLAKNPRERFAHTADLAADLRTIRDYQAEATSAVATPAAARRSRWPTRAAMAALIATSAFALAQVMTSSGRSVHFDRITPFATDAVYQGAPAWSPDGKTIAYEAEINGVVQIFTRALGSAAGSQVTTSMFDCYGPMWSADSRYIYYTSLARDRDALWKVSPAGGAPQTVVDDATQAAISHDGRSLAFLKSESSQARRVTLWLASPMDKDPQRYSGGVLKDTVFSDGRVQFSPDGSRLMAWLWPADGAKPTFWEIPLPGGEPRETLRSLTGPGRAPPLFAWLTDNRHVVMTRSDGPTPGSHLWVADTKTDSLYPLTTTAGNENAPSVSPDGRTIAFNSETTDFDLVEVPIDGGPLRPFLNTSRNEFDPAASPVNTQYAFVTDRTGNLQIWVQNEEGYLRQQLVTEANFGGASSVAVGSLAFSPDGKRLAFQWARAPSGNKPGGSRLWVTSVSGGTPIPIGGDETFQDAPTWSPDGEWIAYATYDSLVKIRVGGGGAPIVLKPDIPSFIARPQWSPDGKWILCETADGLSLIGSDGASARVISDPGWFAYAWATDGRRIYGLRPTDADQHHFMFVSLDVQTGAERVINGNLGTIPQANQPIRGFSRLHNRGFLTSIARARSDIHFLEGFRLQQAWWARFWPFTKAGQR
jgi:serine/threonine protein kinase/Tol biopolymer transport system component